ncbi:MAG: glycoside hydrolase family 3 protein [Caldilineaceae bacterium]|nr:glycoside hydrolase family 3 protein [Caldilineaceae bacterium]
MAATNHSMQRANTGADARPTLPELVMRGPRLLPAATLDEKIGQMLMLGFSGTAVDAESVIASAIRDHAVGSIVFFEIEAGTTSRVRNIASPDQVRELTAALQTLAGSLPLLIAVDQEGGQVTRLSQRRGFPATASAAALGRLSNLDETRAAASAMAATIADVGIQLNLAPVVDVAVNPNNPVVARLERSFSDDPEAVAAQAAAYIDGHHEHGVKCTLKHFPGHGSSRGDTHQGFVDVTEWWSEAELIPYQRLLEAGKVDAIMTAHIFNANLDPDLPGTLSPAVINGLLRGRLGYDGAVISDDLRMRAISDLFRLDRAMELAIIAGVDIIAVTHDQLKSGPVADTFRTTVHRMLDAGVIDEARIDQSFRRVMQLKGLAG